MVEKVASEGQAPGRTKAAIGGLWAVASDDLPQHNAKAVDVHGHSGCAAWRLRLVLVFRAAAAQLRHQLRRDVPWRAFLCARKGPRSTTSTTIAKRGLQLHVQWYCEF